MADSIRIRITGDDSEFLRTLASLEDSARATLDGLAAAAAVAGEAFGAAAARYGESLGAAGGLRLFESEEGATRQAARLAEAVARVWSGAAALEAPSLTLPRSLLDPEALLQSLRAALETDFSAAAEALRAALTEGYLRPGFEGVDWEGFAARFAEALAQTGMQGAQALAATAPALGEAGRAATAEVPAAMDASSSAARAGRSTANGWISGLRAAWARCAHPRAPPRAASPRRSTALWASLRPQRSFAARAVSAARASSWAMRRASARRSAQCAASRAASSARRPFRRETPQRPRSMRRRQARTATTFRGSTSDCTSASARSPRPRRRRTGAFPTPAPNGWRQDGGTHDEKVGIRMV